MTGETLAILISCASLVLAAVALGWNIYRDVVHRASLKVTITWGIITLGRDKSDWPHRLVVTITNFGPGKNRACMLHLRKSSLWLRLRRKTINAILMHDYEDVLTSKIPSDLEVGDKIDLTFRAEEQLFIRSDNFNQIGVTDPFGRTHWCKRKDYKRVRKSFLEDTQHNNSESGRNGD